MVLKGRVLRFDFLLAKILKKFHVMSKRRVSSLLRSEKWEMDGDFFDESWFKTPKTQESPENMYCVHLSDIWTD